MVHMRETRGCALETKFLIDASLGARIGAWARAHLSPDPHGSGSFSDEYETSSVYFDTSQYEVFHRHGSFGRAKYRVRRYGTGDQVFLERKLRRDGLLIKRRTIAPLAHLDRLEQPGSDPAWGGHWFHRRLLLRRLRPVCQVSYHRVARTIELPEGLARLTLDSHLRALPLAHARFAKDGAAPFFDGQMILELKYRVRVPAIFRRLIEEFALSPRAASKYRLALAALGPVPARAGVVRADDGLQGTATDGAVPVLSRLWPAQS
jgi:hypothetical protein